MIQEILNNVKKHDVLTKFLTLEEQEMLKHSGYKVLFSCEKYERKRAYISKDDIDEDLDFQITVLKISYNKKFCNIEHKDVLGALIGLGLRRECIGDIILNDDILDIYVLVTSEIASFIILNLNTVGRAAVSVTKTSTSEIASFDSNGYILDEILVSSYRLDTIISERCNLSREKAKQYIALKNVKVNGVLQINPDYQVKIDELISIHRFGRLIIKEEVRKTKKDKYVLKILRTK